jgi:hypothetical protein
MADANALDDLAAKQDVDFVVLIARRRLCEHDVLVEHDLPAEASARHDLEVQKQNARVDALRRVYAQLWREVGRGDLDVARLPPAGKSGQRSPVFHSLSNCEYLELLP